MPNIPVLRIGNTDYRLKDAEARTLIGANSFETGMQLVDGYCITNEGVRIADTDRKITQRFRVFPGSAISYIGDNANSSVNGISFYNEKIEYISGDANSGTLGEYSTVRVPGNAMYAVITTTKDINYKIDIKKGDVEYQLGVPEVWGYSVNEIYEIFRNGNDNLLYANGSTFIPNRYFSTALQESFQSEYDVFSFYVTSGTTYYITGKVRFISKYGEIIENYSGGETNPTFTADFTGTAYITFYRNNRNYIVSTIRESTNASPFFEPFKKSGNFAQTTGLSESVAMSQKAVTEALAGIVEGNMETAVAAVLNGKTLAVFGDSIMKGNENNNTGIAELIATKYNMPSGTWHNLAVGGATMGYLDEQHSHIIDQINSAISDSISPDIIIFNGGTNDMNNTPPNCAIGTVSTGYGAPSASDEFSNGFETVARTIKNTWHDATVIYMRPHNMSSRLYDRQIDYGERAIEICHKWGIAVIDMYNRMNTQLDYYENTYLHDSTHPNNAGYNRYYIPAIEQYLYEHRNEI